MIRPQLFSFFAILSILLISAVVKAEPGEQIHPTATAVPVNLPTPIPIITVDAQITASVLATRTATPEGAALLEAITEANIRAEPDPESERLGTIRAGDTYNVIGRYFRWYQFQYDQSPSGTGWVFDELVNISGNANRIPDLSLGTATPDVSANRLGSTLIILTRTPGGVLTATAEAGVIPLPIESGDNITSSIANDSGLDLATSLPTFTIPPNLSLVTPEYQLNTLEADSSPETTQGVEVVFPSRISPIMPILILGGFGVLGLLISFVRK